ncbi:LUD domain-containing protein, partial [Campylobacter jejuni]|uniref:LUD domain-containing protein n=1 Tax=Campylobacter jejuni TaxID=197 RepID=UPI0018F89ECD
AKYGFKSMIYEADVNLNIEQTKAEKRIGFDKESENLRSEVFHRDLSIIHARAGVSFRGVAVIPSSKAQPKMLSLASKLCIVLLKKENIGKRLSGGLNLVKK